MEKVLIVEDEPSINRVLKAYMKKDFEVEQAYDGMEALHLFKRWGPSLVLLDVMLPGKNGWALLREFREVRFCPVIMITALGEVNDRLKGFEHGADDYISKPFYGDEVVARVKAVLRRTRYSDEENTFYRSFGGLKVDLDASRVYVKEKEIFLPPRELALLLWFTGNPNKTFTRSQLLDAVWGIDFDGSDRAVDLSIKRLRQYLREWPQLEGEIKTIRGLGYQMIIYEER